MFRGSLNDFYNPEIGKFIIEKCYEESEDLIFKSFVNIFLYRRDHHKFKKKLFRAPPFSLDGP